MNWEDAGKKNADFFDTNCKAHGNVGWKASSFLSHDLQCGVHHILLSRLNLQDKSVLDVGCGQADLVLSLAKSSHNPKSYHGIDVSSEMISHAREKYTHDSFTHGNFLDPQRLFDYDIVVGAGPFNYRVESDDESQFEYLKVAIAKMFASCKYACAFSLLSAYGYESARKWETLACYEPCDVLRYCLTLTSSVVVDHASLPAEFAVFLYHDS